MNETASSRVLPHHAIVARLREGIAGALFTFVLLLPRLLRKRISFVAFRLVLGLSGAALVLVPLGSGNNWVTSFVGLAIFAAAVLLPAPKPDSRADRKASELGALSVVNGGRYQPGNGPAVSARLFVGLDNIWALDAHFQPQLVIPTAEISSVLVTESNRIWALRIKWTDNGAEFFYRGLFAERFALAAEAALQAVLSLRAPAIPKRRAAGA